MDLTLDSQNLLRRGDAMRVNEAVTMVRESRAKPGPRSHGENHAARPAMQVQDQIAAGRSSADLIDITIVLKDGGESRFDHDCDFEVGPVRLEK